MIRKLHIHDMPVSFLIIVCVIPLLLAVLMLFGELCINIYQETISDHVKEELRLYTDSTASYLDSMLSEILRSSYTVYASQPLRRELQMIQKDGKHLSTSEELRIYNDVIDPLFSSINSPQRYVVRLYLVDNYLHSDFSSVYHIDWIPEGLPVEDMLSRETVNTYWNIGQYRPAGLSGMAGIQTVLCFSRVIFSTDMSPLAIVIAEINIDPLEDITSIMVEEGQGSAYLWELNNGQIVFSYGDMDEQYWTATSLVRSNGSLFRAGFSNEIIIIQSSRQRFLLLGVAVVLTVIASAFIMMIMHFAFARIQRVMRKFSELSDINLGVPLEGKDEAATLDRTFSSLFLQYKEKVDEALILQRVMDSIRSHLLLSRINPHFLYNTLSAMKWSVIKSGNKEIAGIVDSMVAFYRGVLGGGRDYATLDMEINTLQEYLRIYEFTYSGKIILTTDIQDDVGRFFILKFLLQPVMENALVHSHTDGLVGIYLNAKVVNNSLELSIWNNGVAIDKTIMTKINAYNGMHPMSINDTPPDSEGKDSYGVFNVITRIQILFNGNYGLWYEAPETGGTLARFVLPLLSQPPLSNDIGIDIVKSK